MVEVPITDFVELVNMETYETEAIAFPQKPEIPEPQTPFSNSQYLPRETCSNEIVDGFMNNAEDRQRKVPEMWPPVKGEVKFEILRTAISKIKQILSYKSTYPKGSTHIWYQQILQVLYWQLMRPKICRKVIAMNVAIEYEHGKAVVARVLQQECTWITTHHIERSRQGKHSNVVYMLEAEGTLLAVREYLSESNEHISSVGLANAVKSHWSTRTIDFDAKR
ncbi:hypothetical protein HOY82DRAFT_543984 [Tuber indicum]|nr:hypothetical protein HOY82DRAFT_543984 [Tuber indicum]